MSNIENNGAIVIKVAKIYFSVTCSHSLQTITMARILEIEDKITRRYSQFNDTQTQYTVRIFPV